MQSKKLNNPSLPPLISGIFILSLMYWCYLSISTRMIITFDSIDYEALGRMIQSHGWTTYFTTGPHREPLYPLLIAISMSFENMTGLAYVKIMAFLGVILLLLTQALTYWILRLLNIRQGVCALALAYLALSPSLNNAAFSLYSEIAAFPILLGITLVSFFAWEAMNNYQLPKALAFSALLGILLTIATLIKAIFECISPAYLIIFFTLILLTDKKRKATTLLLCVAAAASFFYIPITGYKGLNKHYNGNFVITNRGSWALYGNTARRMEPLTLKRFAEALAYAPGEGVCHGLFGAQECDFWSFKKSDEFGFSKLNELGQEHLSADEINTAFLGLSTRLALQNPLQYSLLTTVEGLKMFFWESTQIGFVEYPHWLQKIYNTKLINNGLRFITSLITISAFISLLLGTLRTKNSPLCLLISILISLYFLFFSFFFILTRYALPIAPLYLIIIGVWINKFLSYNKTI